ncbi:ATP-binding protein [Actinophytocola sp.]|uniref:ATP-binding protein n=1 Tax=Actinophytocola sp. TaxID=1872138 RepID=UPI002ED4D09C
MDLVGGASSRFGQLLLEHRRAAGMTQEDLAEASGVSVRALRDLERGRAQAAQRRSAEALADALALVGKERERFLSAAREGRRRTQRTNPVTAALPPALLDLVGRDRDLRRLCAEAIAGAATIAVVGRPGVGKTALAVSAAHALRPEFPDGCFAVDLRGMDDQPVTPRAALDRLLRALGVPPSEIPASEADQSDLYRTVLDGRRVLVLLDNAADEAQVRPLLAAAPGCLTLITCRRTLAGLEAARWLWLEPLADSAAVELLATIAGPERVRTEPDAAAELVALCESLPLAVRIAGNRLATRPHWSLAYLLGQLRDERTRLSSLSAGDLQVRSAFEMSYRRLSPGARLVFRRLAALPGSDFGAELAHVATGLTEPDVHLYLDELADASLLQVTPTEGRYQFHDLIRIFAGERWAAEEKPGEREQVVHAVLDHLLGTASAAGMAFFPEADTDGFPSRDEAGEWLAREESSWIAAQREAARLGLHQQVLDLAKAMHWYSDGQWMGLPWDEIFLLGVEAARALGNRPDEAKLLNFLGWAQVACLCDEETALVTHQQALVVAIETGDRLEEAWSHAYIGSVLTRLGRPEEGLEPVRRSCELAREFGFWPVQLSARNRLGRVLQALGRYEEALDVHRGLLADAEQRGGEEAPDTRRWLVNMVVFEVGHCLLGMREWRQAAATFRESRMAFAELNSIGQEGHAALNEGRAWLGAGEYAKADECLRHALATYAGTAPTPWKDQVLAELAKLPAE